MERLAFIEAFLTEAGAAFAYDDLLTGLRSTVIPNLARFPRMGKRYLDQPPQSVEALDQLAQLPSGTADALRVCLHSDFSCSTPLPTPWCVCCPFAIIGSCRLTLPACGQAEAVAHAARAFSTNFPSIHNTRLAGVGTPSTSPRLTTWPFRKSISLGLPRIWVGVHIDTKQVGGCLLRDDHEVNAGRCSHVGLL